MRNTWIFTFAWDPAKARLNLRKHGVSFERAASVFRDPHALSVFDRDHSQHEDRWLTLGCDGSNTILVVHHTFVESASGTAEIRIISARRATVKEQGHYGGA